MLVEQTLYGTVDKVAEAIHILREYEPDEGYYVAFSGGKDSLCVYWLTKIAGVKADYHYSFTTVDPPELIKFIRTFDDVQIEHPGVDKTMWQLIIKNRIPPSRKARYCCTILKESGGKDRIKILGIRAEESNNRKGRQVVQRDDMLGKTVINLIYHWTLLDVWEFIHCNLIDYCPLYDEGFDRLGCIGCPLKGEKGMLRDFKRWPLYKQAYIRAFDQVIEERRKRGTLRDWHTGEDVMLSWLHLNSNKPTSDQQLTLWEDDNSCVLEQKTKTTMTRRS